MRYVSTRGAVKDAGFDRVLRQALAPDGGLYLPDAWPDPVDWRSFRGAPFEAVVAEVLYLFAAPLMNREEARALSDSAFASFRHEDRVPVEKVGNDLLLELFHGPTLAFKDVAMQLIGKLYERDLDSRSSEMTVVVATSGDTGGAAVSALAGKDGTRLCVLHPHARISDVQRRFMTTSGASNVINLAVDGTFDDCQALVKALFADRAFAEEVSLSGVNSINWARIAAQASYYIKACLDLGHERVNFSVPTGNFGDVFAGYVAKQLGAPVGDLVIAVNDNDILDRALRTGVYKKQGIRSTEAPSMDIEIASNFERALFLALARDAETTHRLMGELREEGGFTIPADGLVELRRIYRSFRSTHEHTFDEMRRVWEEGNELIDPHTAIGLRAARLAAAEGLDGPIVTLATAHPAKFPRAVAAATGVRPDLPVPADLLFDNDEQFTLVPPTLEAVKNAIRR